MHLNICDSQPNNLWAVQILNSKLRKEMADRVPPHHGEGSARPKPLWQPWSDSDGCFSTLRFIVYLLIILNFYR